jgi:hypothetical protein
MIPKSPGMMLFRITFAPNAAENAGAVPLPPMVMARIIASMYGTSKWLNKGEIILAFINRAH